MVFQNFPFGLKSLLQRVQEQYWILLEGIKMAYPFPQKKIEVLLTEPSANALLNNLEDVEYLFEKRDFLVFIWSY